MATHITERWKIPETGAALFNRPTSSSNSVANTEEGNLMDGALEKEAEKTWSQYICSQFLIWAHSNKNMRILLRPKETLWVLLKSYNKCYFILGKFSEFYNDSYVKCWQHQFSCQYSPGTETVLFASLKLLREWLYSRHTEIFNFFLFVLENTNKHLKSPLYWKAC